MLLIDSSSVSVALLSAGKCSSTISQDTTCTVQASQALAGLLDLCTKEGVKQGTNLPDVFLGNSTGVSGLVVDVFNTRKAGP